MKTGATMAHDIRLTEQANIQQAELLLVAFEDLLRSEGEPWQIQSRESKMREVRQWALGEE